MERVTLVTINVQAFWSISPILTHAWMTLSTPTKGHGINGIPQWKTHSRLVSGLTNESTSHNPLATSKI